VTEAESIRVCLFVGAVGAVYVLAASIGLRWALRRWLKRGAAPSRRRIAFHRVILGLAGFGALCIAYGFWIEPYWVEVTRTRITSPRIPAGTRPIRVVHLSDLHCDPKARLEERLPDLIAAEKPDLIVFSGDAINSREGLPVLKACLSRLASVAPTFVVRGNWDAWFWKEVDLFGGTGVRELNGTAERVEVAGTSVWVAGVAVGSEDKAREALARVPSGAFTLFLYHYPYPEVLGDAGGVDLLCAGHVHGGQIALPLYGALLTLSKHGKRYEAGLYQEGPLRMYVSRGLGMEGGSAPRVRFCARPEVAVIEIAPE
jgi:uncharacterized protein